MAGSLAGWDLRKHLCQPPRSAETETQMFDWAANFITEHQKGRWPASRPKASSTVRPHLSQEAVTVVWPPGPFLPLPKVVVTVSL